LRDVPEHAAIEQLLGFHEVVPAALMGADLDDLLAFLVGIEHRVDACDGVRRGLLDVNVLAGGDGVHHLLAVPMIRRRDQDRVDVLALEDAAVVADDIELEGLAGRRHPLIEPLLVDFGHRDELAVLLPAERIEHTPAAVPGADDRHAHAIVGALDPRSEERPGGRDREGSR
jgi:hypothetical protein